IPVDTPVHLPTRTHELVQGSDKPVNIPQYTYRSQEYVDFRRRTNVNTHVMVCFHHARGLTMTLSRGRVAK
ncbi:hypothetical protein SARC_17509, partial [Sphaeroforma arctica JP610]